MTSSSQPTCQHLLRFKFWRLVLLLLLVNRFESRYVINVRTNNVNFIVPATKSTYVLAEKLFINVLFTRSRVFSTFYRNLARCVPVLKDYTPLFTYKLVSDWRRI
jgi:hypothetical protein